MARTKKTSEYQFEDENLQVEEPRVQEEPQVQRYVQYTGGATVREITRAQWAQAGVSGQADSRWTVTNRHLLPYEDFPQKAIDILMADGKFRIVTADEVS